MVYPVVVVFVDAMNEAFVVEVAEKLSKLIVVTIDGAAAVGSAVNFDSQPCRAYLCRKRVNPRLMHRHRGNPHHYRKRSFRSGLDTLSCSRSNQGNQGRS